ncbi:uncharacterized protein LOC123880673 [Maniola jurtina]|uniref:uncharacterized protein LOC123880673 n=1 Tax=Maniola jurtina TaxID=191418 RepID=UPI001E688950|nr:uncharacterized protein LOC123880673 [Maniola jurtina]
MDYFFKNLKQKLSFENAQECLTDDHDFDVAISGEEKENVREDVFTNVSTEQEDKPHEGVLYKPNEPITFSSQSGKSNPTLDTASSQKTEEPKAPEKKKSNPAIDISVLF